MGYGLSVFLISDDDARILDCKDFDLCDEVLEAINNRFDEYDEMLDFEDEDPISHRTALREIFAGTITRPEYAGVYGWAYELYCSSMGDRLNPNPFVPCRYEWYEQLDQFLESRNIPLQFCQLINDCPIALPEPDDWPCMGHWPHETIAKARATVNNLNDTIEDQDVADAINVVREWFTLAESQPDSMIVGFHG